MKPQLIELTERADDRGALVAIECLRTVPFEIQRVYYVYRTQPGVSRGFHAHHRTQQFAICVSGSCRFLMADGRTTATVTLDRPTVGLLIPPMIWHEMFDFSSNCVLILLANELYDEADYIRDRSEFEMLARQT